MTNPTARLTERRRFLQAASAGLAASALGGNVPANAAKSDALSSGQRTVRDAFWLFGVPAGANNEGWGVPRPSRMTPAEGAHYLGVPNLFMICVKDKPPMPFDQYALAFRPLKRVAWSIVGSGGYTEEAQRKHVLQLARRFGNIVGLFMDDFFRRDGSGALTPEQLKELRKHMAIDGRKLDLYVVMYQHLLHLDVREHLQFIDKITFWTWKSEDLNQLERNFERLEQVAPEHGKLVGCYMWDFGNRGPMPVELMKRQCQLGLNWLRQGRLEGMVFLANSVCDLELEAVEWTRQWIAEVGDQAL
jgi:hypothetical protein